METDLAIALQGYREINGRAGGIWQHLTDTLLLCAQQQRVLLSRPPATARQHHAININKRRHQRGPWGQHSGLT